MNTEAKQSMLQVNFKGRKFEIKKENLVVALCKLGYKEEKVCMEIDTTENSEEFLKKYGLYNEVFLERINELIMTGN